MVRTQIQIHTDQLKWLKHTAVEEGVSMSQLIRDIIDFFRTHTEKSQRLRRQKQNALTAVGSFTSTPDIRN